MPATNAPEQASVRELYRNEEQTTGGVKAPNNQRSRGTKQRTRSGQNSEEGKLEENKQGRSGGTKLKTGIHITERQKARKQQRTHQQGTRPVGHPEWAQRFLVVLPVPLLLSLLLVLLVAVLW